LRAVVQKAFATTWLPKEIPASCSSTPTACEGALIAVTTRPPCPLAQSYPSGGKVGEQEARKQTHRQTETNLKKKPTQDNDKPRSLAPVFCAFLATCHHLPLNGGQTFAPDLSDCRSFLLMPQSVINFSLLPLHIDFIWQTPSCFILIQKSKIRMLQNPKLLDHQHEATSRKFHPMKLCFLHKTILMIPCMITFRLCG
jgi:hypothetical protein